MWNALAILSIHDPSPKGHCFFFLPNERKSEVPKVTSNGQKRKEYFLKSKSLSPPIYQRKDEFWKLFVYFFFGTAQLV